MKILKISIKEASSNSKICFETRNEKYFLAYETNPAIPISILFKNLNFLKKFYGIKNKITKKSLNETRKNEIKNLKRALKFNVPLFELDKIDFETKKIKINPKTNEPYSILKLTKFGRINYQKNIDKGLIVLCEYV